MADWRHMAVHYESRCYNETNEIGIEFHSEPKLKRPFNWNSVREAVQSFRGLKIKNTEVHCYAKNRIMKSGLEIKLTLSSNIKDICEHMAELIKVTKSSITEALMT